MEITKRKGRGRPPKQKEVYTPQEVNFDKLTQLDDLNIDPKMLESMSSNKEIIDEFLSHEGGIPCATNIMTIGDPGVGKTTVLLEILSRINESDRKCLFISGEMGRKQMYKYTQRFTQFGGITTLFLSDYLEYNTRDVIEQVLNQGWDLVLIDSVAEVLDGVRDDNSWDRKTAESWLVDLCVTNNKGENQDELYSSFLLIQQVTKGGEFVGSNKLKHMTDATLEIRKRSERDGGGTYMSFTKNRNGNIGKCLNFTLNSNNIYYSSITDE